MFKFKTTLAAAACALLLSTPALAGHCPKDAKAIDTALAGMELSDDLKAEVQSLRDEGMKLHDSGNHADAERKLAQAMRMLLESSGM